jgi:hypothetical protein
MIKIGDDLLKMMGDRKREFLKFFLGLFKPPSNEPIHKWAEKNVELAPSTSKVGGKIRFDLFPLSVFFLDCCQNKLTRRISRMAGRQCSKTEDAITYLLWAVVNKPRPTMWCMALADMIEDFAKDRLYPAFQNCKAAYEYAPKERKYWTKRFLKLLSMSLYLRGSKSKAKLQSTPVGLLICDERKDWEKGSINIVRKTMTTFSDGLEISMGVAGDKDDEWHQDCKKGSESFLQFPCLSCGQFQYWRPGRAATSLHPIERQTGGLWWPENDETKPDGKWDYEKVKQQARWECEVCGHKHTKEEKFEMIKRSKVFHRNPNALPRNVSIYQNQCSAPWESCEFGELAVMFLQANESMKRGDIEPLKNYITEVCGEPWEPMVSRKGKEDLLKCVGQYKMGECWRDAEGNLEKDTVLLMSLDRQLLYVRYVIRQWKIKTGDSRMIEFGKVATLDEARSKQHEWKIMDKAVWCDDRGPNVSTARQKAAQCGWGWLLGSDYENFKPGDSKTRQGWAKTKLDPGIGTTMEGRANMLAFHWSNKWYKDKLYWLFIPRLGPLWELPIDVPADYLAEVSANEWREKVSKTDGSTEGFWYEAGDDHAADCELMQIVAADLGNMTRTVASQNPTQK